ncbi:MAG: hypothetical protein QG594_378, partial [Bacteroidota bacterium]|nr:hypothetical protein [Bacteroidota bacterium]
ASEKKYLKQLEKIEHCFRDSLQNLYTSSFQKSCKMNLPICATFHDHQLVDFWQKHVYKQLSAGLLEFNPSYLEEKYFDNHVDEKMTLHWIIPLYEQFCIEISENNAHFQNWKLFHESNISFFYQLLQRQIHNLEAYCSKKTILLDKANYKNAKTLKLDFYHTHYQFLTELMMKLDIQIKELIWVSQINDRHLKTLQSIKAALINKCDLFQQKLNEDENVLACLLQNDPNPLSEAWLQRSYKPIKAELIGYINNKLFFINNCLNEEHLFLRDLKKLINLRTLMTESLTTKLATLHSLIEVESLSLTEEAKPNF